MGLHLTHLQDTKQAAALWGQVWWDQVWCPLLKTIVQRGGGGAGNWPGRQAVAAATTSL
jgi:hypothetical protein